MCVWIGMCRMGIPTNPMLPYRWVWVRVCGSVCQSDIRCVCVVVSGYESENHCTAGGVAFLHQSTRVLAGHQCGGRAPGPFHSNGPRTCTSSLCVPSLTACVQGGQRQGF